MKSIGNLYLAAGLSVCFLAGCKGGAEGEASTDPADLSKPNLPLLSVTQPARGAFLAETGSIVGQVQAGDAAITRITLNDAQVEWVGDGYFEAPIPQAEGIVILGIRATDADGERAVDGRSIHVGAVNAPGQVIPRAVGIRLGSAFFDDDEPDLDDMAGLIEAVLETPDLSTVFSGQVFSSSGVDFSIQRMTVQDAAVDIWPYEGVFEANNVLKDVTVNFHVEGPLGLNGDGLIHIDQVDLFLDVDFGYEAGAVAISVPLVSSYIDGLTWEMNGLPGFLTGLLDSVLESLIESQLEDLASSTVVDLVGQTLGSFALNETVGESGEVGVMFNIVDASVDADGAELWMDGRVWANTAGIVLPNNAGSLKTLGGAPPFSVFGDSFQAMVDDDLLNQVSFAFWHAGLLAVSDLSEAEIVDLTGGLEPPLGPARSLSLNVGLPPVIQPSNGTDYQMDVSVGEVLFEITRQDGQEIAASLNLRGGAGLNVDADGVGVELDTRPRYLVNHVGVIKAPDGLDPGSLASLFRLAAPSLLSKSTDAAPRFPPPSVDLDALFSFSVFSGKQLVASDLEHQMTSSGWLIVDGKMVESEL